MNDNIRNIEDRLNDIIRKNEDSVKGYEKAVENTTELGLQSYFRNKARERRIFLEELKSVAPALNTRDEIDGSTLGALHRTWMDIKAFFSGDDEEAMLEEAIRGDNAAIDEYNEVLVDVRLPSEAAAVIRRQRDRLKEDLHRIKTLEDLR
ncbi:PA2169 family four-helix-bundle protein [Arenibacter algicola]|uniref:ferritin-like domain-containing protein n=1 Tax=Arenibacter algicola TaxID=616991 RepID=UPI001C06A011|nr:PA2169 family four-helix-bundle protein [Arenibacter algicola]MBU2905955.1 PA2169 family four-helix-bundle protein [Arenibacter algicola]